MTTDVLIVGPGPTGLMLANQLGRRGVRAMIVDRHSGPAQQSRAMAVPARTLEIYARLGVADQAVALGAPGNGANIWVHGRKRARVPLQEIGKGVSPFPYVLMLGPDDNERILGAHLRRWNMHVQWNTELVALEQHADHVSVTLKDLDGREAVTVSYVAGCDGGRSAVRQMNGIDFVGEPYDHVFFVADTEATGPMVPGELNSYVYRDGFNSFFPMRGRNGWRVIGILPEELRERPGLTFDDIQPWLSEETGRGLSFQACHWFSTYRTQHRCAERFRDRRCFLLGDAAHVHSPMDGQGMNTGVQDAYNLGWKLALVVAGRADDALLDSCAAEREPVAHRLLETTARARQSPLSRTIGAAPEAPQAGDRFPWLQLALRGQPAPATAVAGFEDLVDVVAVPRTPKNDAALAAVSVDGPAFYLIRPDGYVALAGTRFDDATVRLWFADHQLHPSAPHGQAGRRLAS